MANILPHNKYFVCLACSNRVDTWFNKPTQRKQFNTASEQTDIRTAEDPSYRKHNLTVKDCQIRHGIKVTYEMAFVSTY